MFRKVFLLLSLAVLPFTALAEDIWYNSLESAQADCEANHPGIGCTVYGGFSGYRPVDPDIDIGYRACNRASNVWILAWPEEGVSGNYCVRPFPDFTASGFSLSTGIQYAPGDTVTISGTGTLFEGRFKAHLVQTSDYFLHCTRYIELNPVRAGMVEDPGDYSWSSYRAHAFGTSVRLWTPHQVYIAMGITTQERQEHYRRLLREDMGHEVVDDIRRCIQTGFVLGNDEFREQVEALTGEPQSFRRRGRRPNVSET